MTGIAMPSLQYLFAIAVAGSAFGTIMMMAFVWGVIRLERRGEDGVGSLGWMAMILPLVLFLSCMAAIKVESDWQQQAARQGEYLAPVPANIALQATPRH